MIKSLDYTVTFPSTGRTLSGQYRFQEGLGVITGPNESGKSMISEMIRYGLFGSAALRGSSEDYTNLKLVLCWGDYKVSRGSKDRLYRVGSDEPIAVGTRSVNEKIVKILGFGLDVFDVANVANQGDIEKLGDMKPAERKRMVDSVIGMGLIEDLAKWSGDEALILVREADAVEGTLRRPEKPSRPDGYIPSDELRPRLAKLTTLRSEADQIEGWLSTGVTAPGILPPWQGKDMVELNVLIGFADELTLLRKELARIPAPPVVAVDVESTRSQWEAFDLWQERLRFLKEHPLPEMTINELEKAEEDLILQDSFDDLIMTKEAYGRLKNRGSIDCPNCGHNFCLEHENLSTLDTKIAELTTALAGLEYPTEHDPEYVARQRKRHIEWETLKNSPDWLRLENSQETSKPLLTRAQLDEIERHLELQKQRPELERRITNIVEMLDGIDPKAQLLELERWKIQAEEHRRKSEAYLKWEATAETKRKRLLELSTLLLDFDTVRSGLETSVAYEQSMISYEALLSIYDEGASKVRDLREAASGWKAAKSALTLLRSLIKQHLVPSLNKVASHLLNQMTGGERQVINVTEDFEITVDGQKLNLLSGSGKVVANLAIRLGLGQVLTNNVLSLFIGDEIDASMDKNRADNTTLTLRNLTDHISQIFLITHKSPEADWHIQLGNNSGRQPLQKSG